MPMTRCQYCDQVTSSSVSNYWRTMEPDGETPKETEITTACFAAFVDEQWVEGCAYNQADVAMKMIVDNLIAHQGV